MSQFNTRGEPRSSDGGHYDAPDPTPYELVVMDNTDLRARLSNLDSERNADLQRLQFLLSACADMLVCIRDNPDFQAEQRKAARALMAYGVVRVCNQELSVGARAGL